MTEDSEKIFIIDWGDKDTGGGFEIKARNLEEANARLDLLKRTARIFGYKKE